jgi:hypothetical protein
MNWSLLSLIFGLLLLGFSVLYFLKVLIEKKFGKRKSPAWGCGYERLDARMQYTASSFADQLNTIPEKVLGYYKKFEGMDEGSSGNVAGNSGLNSAKVFPARSRFETHSQDLVDEKAILPGFRFLKSFVLKIEFLSHPDIRYSIGFILVIITIYCFVAFLWK